MKKYSSALFLLLVIFTSPVIAQTGVCSFKINPDGSEGHVFDRKKPSRGMADKDKRWEVGKVIYVKFLEGTAFMQNKVMGHVREWEKYANIKFQVVESGNAQLRVGFDMNDGHWSKLGTDALYVPQNEKTINLALNDSSAEWEYRRRATHEFGHALGLLHEHYSPLSGINWNKRAVYKLYVDTLGWDSSAVDYNLFIPMNESYTNGTSYDPQSIMHYPIDSYLTTNGFGIGWNLSISEGDKTLIGKLYPKTAGSELSRGKPICSGICAAPALFRDTSGIAIYPIMDIQNAYLKDIVAVAYFSDAQRKPLLDMNGQYVDVSNKQIATSKALPWSLDNYQPVNQSGLLSFALYIPFKELQLKKGTNKLKYDVKIFYKEAGRMNLIYESKYYDLTLTMK
ncbi:MAG: M12 family metallopeptidase [Chitinophagaceae bacterium]|nr:M12 family metallopeptidase [Chitinophagaceae bacterium]